MKRLLVLREIRQLNGGVRAISGGALKTFEYFGHAKASGLVEARLMLIPPRPWDDLLDSYVEPHEVVTETGEPDIVMLSREWADADHLGLTSAHRPIIQILQNQAHATPGRPEYLSLSRTAVRIVVAREFADHIRTLQHLAGDLVVIEAAVSMPRKPSPWDARARDVTISGKKNPPLARAVGELLTVAGCSVRTLESGIPRPTYLELVGASRVLVALPHPVREVAFLTALEGMYLDVAVVLPKTFGPGGYCVDGVSCLTTTNDAADIAQRTLGLLKDPAMIEKLRRGGAEVTKRITMENERRSFIEVLARVVSGVPVSTSADSGPR